VIIWVDSFCANMSYISSQDSSKPPSPHKANLMKELEEIKRDLAKKEESIRYMRERLQSLEDS